MYMYIVVLSPQTIPIDKYLCHDVLGKHTYVKCIGLDKSG